MLSFPRGDAEGIYAAVVQAVVLCMLWLCCGGGSRLCGGLCAVEVVVTGSTVWRLDGQTAAAWSGPSVCRAQIN